MSLETNTNQAHNNILNDAQKIEFRFDHFCFETDDQQGIILNYATLPPLMKNMLKTITPLQKDWCSAMKRCWR